jgi:hypothetical protein
MPLMSIFLMAVIALQTGEAESKRRVGSAQETGFRAIKEANLRANLAFIAGDGLRGRMSLQPGDDAAAEWVAAEFAKSDLKPAAGGSFLQPVPLVEYRNDRQQSRLSLKRGGAEKEWRFPEAFGAFAKDVDVSGEAVFAGFGITAPELGYDDYRNIDARGKIVLIFDHEPQETDAHSIFNGTGNTRYATTRVKVLNAQAHGAIGVIIVAEPKLWRSRTGSILRTRSAWRESAVRPSARYRCLRRRWRTICFTRLQ